MHSQNCFHFPTDNYSKHWFEYTRMNNPSNWTARESPDLILQLGNIYLPIHIWKNSNQLYLPAHPTFQECMESLLWILDCQGYPWWMFAHWKNGDIASQEYLSDQLQSIGSSNQILYFPSIISKLGGGCTFSTEIAVMSSKLMICMELLMKM